MGKISFSLKLTVAAPQKIDPHSHPKKTMDTTLFGERVLADAIMDLKMRSSWISRGPLHPVTTVLTGDTQRRARRRRQVRMKSEAQIGVGQLHAK